MSRRVVLNRAVAVLIAAGLVVAGGACSDDDPSTSPSTSTSGGTSVTTAPGEVTVRGTVASVFASAAVLRFEPAVGGYSTVALGPSTEYRRADGSPALLQDVVDGSTVEVTGAPGAPGSLIARLVVVTG